MGRFSGAVLTMAAGGRSGTLSDGVSLRPAAELPREDFVQSLILTLHIIVCVLLVILILLQSGKEGMGVIFGGGNSSVFGSTGAGGVLAKLTALMAVIFVITSLSYTYVSSSRPSSESVILNVQIEGDQPQKPAADVPKAPESGMQPAQPPEAPAPQAPEAAKQAGSDGSAAPAEAPKE